MQISELRLQPVHISKAQSPGDPGVESSMTSVSRKCLAGKAAPHSGSTSSLTSGFQRAP